MNSIFIRIRSNYWIHLFTLNLRNLLGIGFVIGGLRKVNGQPFANLGQGGPFFDLLDALHSIPEYYEFIGWAQFVAGALLITQRFATFGAVVYFPIILNISIFTVFSIGSLTPWIASLMCLGALFLLIWDYHKWIHLFSKDNHYHFSLKDIEVPTYDRKWLINGALTLLIPSLGFIPIMLWSMDPSPESIKLMRNIFISSILLTLLINLLVNIISVLEWTKKK